MFPSTDKQTNKHATTETKVKKSKKSKTDIDVKIHLFKQMPIKQSKSDCNV